MIINFNEFLRTIIVENLHPELQDIINKKAINDDTKLKKITQIAAKTMELKKRGEKTGIEGNMPRGSSRAYLKHQEPHDAIVDGKATKLKMGTKIAIDSSLDDHHLKENFDDKSLGEMQNDAEMGDETVNSKYRILTKDSGNPNNYTSNKQRGIFPPLFNYDNGNSQWANVGHADDITKDKFNKLTVTKEFPNGISHSSFCDVLDRNYNRQKGNYWPTIPTTEKYLDDLESHPLVKKFKDYHDEHKHPAFDYRQISNMGVWKHPDGSEHIVARDHGFSTRVSDAYHAAVVSKG